MTTLRDQHLRTPRGGSATWTTDNAGQLLAGEFFPEAGPAGDPLYIGANWAAKYLGATAEASLYLGVKALHA